MRRVHAGSRVAESTAIHIGPMKRPSSERLAPTHSYRLTSCASGAARPTLAKSICSLLRSRRRHGER
jgi:hypothetical protein